MISPFFGTFGTLTGATLAFFAAGASGVSVRLRLAAVFAVGAGSSLVSFFAGRPRGFFTSPAGVPSQRTALRGWLAARGYVPFVLARAAFLVVVVVALVAARPFAGAAALVAVSFLVILALVLAAGFAGSAGLAFVRVEARVGCAAAFLGAMSPFFLMIFTPATMKCGC